MCEIREESSPYVLCNNLVSGFREVEIDEMRKQRHFFFLEKQKESKTETYTKQKESLGILQTRSDI